MILKSLPTSDNSRNQKHFHYLLIITICRCSSCLHFIQTRKNAIKRNVSSQSSVLSTKPIRRTRNTAIWTTSSNTTTLVTDEVKRIKPKGESIFFSTVEGRVSGIRLRVKPTIRKEYFIKVKLYISPVCLAFPAEGIFNTLEICFLHSNRIVQNTAVRTLKFSSNYENFLVLRRWYRSNIWNDAQNTTQAQSELEMTTSIRRPETSS